MLPYTLSYSPRTESKFSLACATWVVVATAFLDCFVFTCPLHSWVIDLESGEAAAPDIGCAPKLPVRVTDGVVFLGTAEPQV